MGKEEAEVGVQAAEVKVVQADAQADLDVALPTLEKALKALDSLTKNDITEVKSFAKPPPAVQTVMEAVCILLEVSENFPLLRGFVSWRWKCFRYTMRLRHRRSKGEFLWHQ